MSKTKLAILLFCIAFGVNLIAFIGGKKAFTIDELKNVWLYELPLTPSPLDAYVSVDLGPQQGIIGTLFKPNFARGASGASGLLAKEWKWDLPQKTLTVILVDGLVYSDGLPILNTHFVESAQWVKSRMSALAWTPTWEAWTKSKITAGENQKLIYQWDVLPAGFDEKKFLSEVLTHPLTGVVHPDNLKALQSKEGVKNSKEWISSGPYKVRKWNPKEIVLVSRNDFPVMLPKEFFREVRYQSAPIKNPSCHFLQSAVGGEDPSEKDLTLNPTEEALHVFWICRSWKDAGHFCSDGGRRKIFSGLMKGEGSTASLLGSVVRYRIPIGSDGFRTKIREMIETKVKAAGGKAEEISYFFKPSKDADIELEFVAIPLSGDEKASAQLAESLALLSSRLGAEMTQAFKPESFLIGEIAHYPMNILMKNDHGEVFQKTFLEPDLAEKKLPL